MKSEVKGTATSKGWETLGYSVEQHCAADRAMICWINRRLCGCLVSRQQRVQRCDIWDQHRTPGLSYPMLSDTGKSAAFFEASQATARLSFWQDSTKMVIVENWQYHTDSKLKYWERDLSQCHLVNTNLTGTDQGSNRHIRGERPATDRLSHDTAETRGSHVSSLYLTKNTAPSITKTDRLMFLMLYREKIVVILTNVSYKYTVWVSQCGTYSYHCAVQLSFPKDILTHNRWYTQLPLCCPTVIPLRTHWHTSGGTYSYHCAVQLTHTTAVAHTKPHTTGATALGTAQCTDISVTNRNNQRSCQSLNWPTISLSIYATWKTVTRVHKKLPRVPIPSRTNQVYINTALLSHSFWPLPLTEENTFDLDILCRVLICFRLQPATRTLLKTSHTKAPAHNELRTRRSMW